MRLLLRSKLHRATVTGADVDYEGSLTIDQHLMELADILPYEQVQCWNVTRATRFTTYAITGERNSGEICVNGAAAHLAKPGDLLIVAAFAVLTESEAVLHKPRVVLLNERNEPLPARDEIPGPRRAVK